MSTMLEQTKRTIETLKKAGFKRSEFSVRTPMDHKHEYASTRINIKCRVDPSRHNIQALVDDGLEVTQYVGFSEDRRKQTFTIRYGYRGVFKVCDCSDRDENGFHIYRIYYRAAKS